MTSLFSQKKEFHKQILLIIHHIDIVWILSSIKEIVILYLGIDVFKQYGDIWIW